ncbi:MAG: hypothetical protein R3A45_07035 [Bdellovibrionota bacterium]
MQKPGKEEVFSAIPSGLYPINLAKKYRIGDVTGDGKADIVFFDTRSSKNHSFKALLNNGVLK